MTSDEIKKLRESLDEGVPIEEEEEEPSSNAEIKVKALLEIAFQLAKLNEHFERVDRGVFGGT